jgi:hypothetical protein
MAISNLERYRKDLKSLIEVKTLMTPLILLKAFFQYFEKLFTLFLRKSRRGHDFLAPQLARDRGSVVLAHQPRLE